MAAAGGSPQDIAGTDLGEFVQATLRGLDLRDPFFRLGESSFQGVLERRQPRVNYGDAWGRVWSHCQQTLPNLLSSTLRHSKSS